MRALCLFALLAASPAEGRVVRLIVEHREAAGAGGQYERLTGHFYGELDPKNALNAIIDDILLAPRSAGGMVEYSATFTLLRPVDSSRVSGVMWYEVPNRGNSPLNPGPSLDAVTAGHILVSSGWQGDLAPRAGVETIAVPIARNADGSPITGPVLYRIANVRGQTASLQAGYAGLRYQLPATLDTAKALLTKPASDDGQVIPISSSEWAFANCEKTPFPGEPDPTRICLKGGFDADQLYQVVYTAKDPLVLGIGLAATRDLVSFLRYSEKGDAGAPNPVAGLVKRAIGFGTSQSGNFIKTFIHLGFNQDESKRIVWDGANPNIAARQSPLNFRFAIPGGAAGLFEPGSEGVLWWGPYRDDARGRPTASLLDRCRLTGTCPKIMETFGASEFWGLQMSPGLVGTDAKTDIPLPPDVRRYYFPGVTHGGGRGGFQTIEPGATGRGCTLPDNPNSTAESMRALRRALTDRVVNDTTPPESRYPTLARGELAAPVRSAMNFPAIPGAPLPDNLINALPNYDFGADFRYNDLSGAISIQPPVVRSIIPMLIPKTDADGNEIGGIPSVLHQAPLGTYLGWNVTVSGYSKGRACGFSGGFTPFAKTKQVTRGPIDYLTLDYLAEVTMSILQKQRARDPEAGYARDFVEMISRILPVIAERNIRVDANAGGLNPLACRRAVLAAAEKQGIPIRVAAVTGDDISGRLDDQMSRGIEFRNMDTCQPLSTVRERVRSANAYIGAFPIAKALQRGAQIVITGRCADAALALGPMIHEFGWGSTDWDLLAAGVVGGHAIECGAQGSGGNCQVDWETIPALDDIGYPILEVEADGEFVVTKHEDTGGRISVASVTEQLLYEIGDPRTYISPDCIADFTTIQLAQAGPDRVRFTGIQGRPATESYKVSISYSYGFKANGSVAYAWPQAYSKAQVGDRILRARLQRLGLKLDAVRSEYLGASACHGILAAEPGRELADSLPEVALRFGVRSRDRAAVERFSKEIAPLVLNGPPSVTGLGAGRPKVEEVVAYWPTLIPKTEITPEVTL